MVLLDSEVKVTGIEDDVLLDTLESFDAMKQIQAINGQLGTHRYIISNCRGAIDMARVMVMGRLCAWHTDALTFDVVPLFETVDDLQGVQVNQATGIKPVGI